LTLNDWAAKTSQECRDNFLKKQSEIFSLKKIQKGGALN
jgi:hypothetical protein